ncbi:pre-mRNA-splicing factor cwc22, partial [Linderina pennispora]
MSDSDASSDERHARRRQDSSASSTQSSPLEPPPALNPTSSTGRYIPPALKRQLLAQSNNASVLQRASWETLKKQINGPVNKVNTSNMREIAVQLFQANLIRGRGLLCRSLMRAQGLSPAFTPVYACLLAVINTKLPVVGELLVTRLVLQFRRAFNRDDKSKCQASVLFLAHLTVQRVAHEVLAFQIIALLLETPTDDSVEIAVGFVNAVGAFLQESAPRVLSAVFDTLRSILHEAEIDRRVQFMIEVLFQTRRDGFKGLEPGLDLVDEEEQIVHEVALDDDELDAEDELNVFQNDKDFAENEQKYADIRREILGEDSSDEGSGSESGSESEESDESEESESEGAADGNGEPVKIHDLTETERVNLRRTIYLAMMSSLSYDEAAHKLLKLTVRAGEEQELCNMVVEACSQERTYKAFFGLVGERLCKLDHKWRTGFLQSFEQCHGDAHRYETGHLRNIAHFFAHLLVTEALPSSVLECVTLTEQTTTSSSRIFVKILLQDMAEELGLEKLGERLHGLLGMFPNEGRAEIRFAINYYTSIGLGAITEEMRERLASMAQESTSSSSESDSDSGSDSGSESSGSYSSSSSYSSRSSRSSYSSASRSPSRSPVRRPRAADFMPEKPRVRSPSYSPPPRQPSPRRRTYR